MYTKKRKEGVQMNPLIYSVLFASYWQMAALKFGVDAYRIWLSGIENSRRYRLGT